MMRYKKEQFAGMPRAKFLKALKAEDIGASGGYSPLNKEPFLKSVLTSRRGDRANGIAFAIGAFSGRTR